MVRRKPKDDRPCPRGYRRLVVGGAEWHWKLGRRYVNAMCEDGRKIRSELHEVLDLSEGEWLKMYRKRQEMIDDLAAHGPPHRNELLELTPAKVAKWISKIA